VICNRCGKENPDNSNFCPQCGLSFNQPNYNIKPQRKRIGCRTVLGIFVMAVLAIVALGLIFGDDKADTTASTDLTTIKNVQTATGSETTKKIETTTKATQEGIDPDKFNDMVKEKLSVINKDGVISKFSTSVYGTTATVKLYLSHLSSWEISDTQRKEFMNTMGNFMDSVASLAAYPGTKTIGTNTILYSPGGLELAERTILGNVKLK